MQMNFTRSVVGTAFGLTFAISSAMADDLSATSQMGTLLDGPESKAVLEKHIPDFVSNPQIEQTRGMSLQSLQAFAPTLTDDVLVEIDKDLAKVSN